MDDSPAALTATTLEIDQIFEILKNNRRRRVLQYLAAADGEVTLGELAERIAAWEQDKEIRQITSQERKRVYVGLYQCHLPKMDDVDAVSYNKARGIVRSGTNFEYFEDYLPDGPAEPDDEPLSVVSSVKEWLSH